MADWEWSGGEWRAEFVWACGVEGMVTTGVDMPTKQFDEFVADSENLACPDCRRAELVGQPPLTGHMPVPKKDHLESVTKTLERLQHPFRGSIQRGPT